MQITLKPHQSKIINHLHKHRGALAIHGTGTGKTIVATFSALTLLAKKIVDRVIFVSPVSLQANFRDTVTKANAKYAKEIQYYTIQGFMHQSNLCKKSLLIIDEAHNLRTLEGTYFNRLLTCAKEATKVLLLSATPIVNYPHDLVNLIALIRGTDPVELSDFYHMMENDNLSNKYLNNVFHFYTRPKDDSDFPKSKIIKKFLVMSPAYEKKYNQIEQGFHAGIDEYKGGDLKVFYNGIRRASNKIDIESPKILFVIKKLKEGERSVVFSHFIEMGMKILIEHLDKEKIPYSIVSGSISKKERERAVNKYNNGEIKVLLISKAGGEGLDLKETKNIFVLEPTWNKSQLDQVVGRGVRYKSHQSSKSVVTVYQLYLIRKWEEKNLDKIIDKKMFSPPSDSKYQYLSIDLYLHNYVELKEEEIKKFVDHMQQFKIK